MKKLIAFLALGLACVLVAKANALDFKRVPVGYKAINYTTNIIGVSTGPAVLYGVILSSGATGEFVAFFDTNTVQGIAANSSNVLVTKFFFVANGSGTVIPLDPPIQFNVGLFAADSAATGQSVILYEKGRRAQ